MHYKILCSDLDGTLLSTKSDVSDYTVEEINRIKEKTRIILVSARMPKAMTYIQKRLGIGNEAIICFNGALILDDEKVIFSTVIELDIVKALFQLTKDHGIKIGLYHGDEWYVEEHTERVDKEIEYTKATPIYRKTSETLIHWESRNIGAHKIMLMGTLNSINDIFPKLKSKFDSAVNIYRSNDTLIEISPKSISKSTAIELLLKGSSSFEDVIAFGDNYNDKQMLQNAHYGVAVANAREEVKSVVDFITLKNTEDGVAHFLNLHFNI